jgi:hypothetical protein
MIVDDLDIRWTIFCPPEANTPLVVDPDRMLAFTVLPQGFEPIGRRDSEVVEPLRRFEHLELATGNRKYLDRKALGALAIEYRFRDLGLETSDQSLAPADRTA